MYDSKLVSVSELGIFLSKNYSKSAVNVFSRFSQFFKNCFFFKKNGFFEKNDFFVENVIVGKIAVENVSKNIFTKKVFSILIVMYIWQKMEMFSIRKKIFEKKLFLKCMSAKT